jgi:hypothetical protein
MPDTRIELRFFRALRADKLRKRPTFRTILHESHVGSCCGLSRLQAMPVDVRNANGAVTVQSEKGRPPTVSHSGEQFSGLSFECDPPYRPRRNVEQSLQIVIVRRWTTPSEEEMADQHP